MDVDWSVFFLDRVDAERAEKGAIQAEIPPFNETHADERHATVRRSYVQEHGARIPRQRIDTGPMESGTREVTRVAGDIRSRIVNGDLVVGAALPTTAQLAAGYAVSMSTIVKAVRELRVAGTLRSTPGKAVYVQALPEPPGASVEERLASLEAWRAEVQAKE